MIRRIGKMLGFKTAARILYVSTTALSHEAAIQIITRIELQPGLRRDYLENSAAPGVIKPGDFLNPGCRAPQGKIVIVAAGKFQLLVIIADMRADDPG